MELKKSDIKSIASNKWQDDNKVKAVAWFIATAILIVIAFLFDPPLCWILFGIGMVSAFGRFIWQIRGIKKAQTQLLKEQDNRL